MTSPALRRYRSSLTLRVFFSLRAAPSADLWTRLKQLLRRAWARQSRTSLQAGTGADIYKRCVCHHAARPRAGGCALRHQFVLPSLCRRNRSLLLSRAAHSLRDRQLRPGTPCARRAMYITSAITGREQAFSFAALHFGDQNITAAVKPYVDSDAPAFEAFARKAAGLRAAGRCSGGDPPLDRYYGRAAYSLTSLFGDERGRSSSDSKRHAQRSRDLAGQHLPESRQPCCTIIVRGGPAQAARSHAAAGFAINAGLRRALEDDTSISAQPRSYARAGQNR